MSVNFPNRQALIDAGCDPGTVDRAIAESVRRERGGARGGTNASASAPVIPGQPWLVSVASGLGWWECRIAEWRPASDNLRAKGVHAWHRGKAQDREVMRWFVAGLAGVPPATGRRKLTLVVEKRDRRGVRDSANLLKSLHDAAKTCGLIIDDDDERLDWDRPRILVVRDLAWKVASTIRLEDTD